VSGRSHAIAPIESPGLGVESVFRERSRSRWESPHSLVNKGIQRIRKQLFSSEGKTHNRVSNDRATSRAEGPVDLLMNR
jgi:hypothetical protein